MLDLLIERLLFDWDEFGWCNITCVSFEIPLFYFRNRNAELCWLAFHIIDYFIFNHNNKDENNQQQAQGTECYPWSCLQSPENDPFL